jgi:NAD(P)-dependent dehydrogenase (short-subunit alcohol dehydrogenase family)
MRAVVVGASSGLGRCIGIGLAKRGARVALLARRTGRLEDAAMEAGSRSIPIRCDVTDESSCREAIGKAAAELGGIDALVYSPAIGPLVRIADIDAQTWQRTFATNVTGAAVITSAALPHLKESGGVAAYLSSVSGTTLPPFPGLAAYVVSKAALERMIEAWRAEHPDVGFTRVIVGECSGGEGHSATEFPKEWNPELAVEFGRVWAARNLIAGNRLDVDELVNSVYTVLTCDASSSIPSITVAPRARA